MAGPTWDLAHPSAPVSRDSNSGWPVEACAVRVERRPVHRLVACAAGPGGVSAAVAEAGLVPDQHLVGSEDVPVGASARRVGDPLPTGGLYQLAQHRSPLVHAVLNSVVRVQDASSAVSERDSHCLRQPGCLFSKSRDFLGRQLG